VPGVYKYKFFVDGKWKFDPNEEFQLNIYKTYDNVIKVSKCFNILLP
jgi:hypothetical protein